MQTTDSFFKKLEKLIKKNWYNMKKPSTNWYLLNSIRLFNNDRRDYEPCVCNREDSYQWLALSALGGVGLSLDPDGRKGRLVCTGCCPQVFKIEFASGASCPLFARYARQDFNHNHIFSLFSPFLAALKYLNFDT